MQQATAEKLEAGQPLTSGQQIEGGYFAGIIHINGQKFGIVVSPKEGDMDDQQWGELDQEIEGTRSFFDGQANTQAMADAGSELAKAIQALNINGHTDWYLPARDELELVYRNLKPTKDENFRLSGDNPSSAPAAYAYSLETPAQTPVTDFQEGGEHAMVRAWYWSSTQSSAYTAWSQDFEAGYQNDGLKLHAFRARARPQIPHQLTHSAI